MDLEELILRFFSLVGGVADYKPPLRQFLNAYMREHRNEVPSAEQVTLFETCCNVVHEVLGDSPFRVAGSKTILNKAFFDAIMVPVAFANHEQLRTHATAIQDMISALPEDDEFRTSIGRATADRFRMLYRIGKVADGLRTIGVEVGLPERFGLDA